MKYPVGEYVIIKHAFWSHSAATTVTIIKYEGEDVIYYYNNEQIQRCRNVHEFDLITLVPYTPLMEELI